MTENIQQRTEREKQLEQQKDIAEKQKTIAEKKQSRSTTKKCGCASTKCGSPACGCKKAGVGCDDKCGCGGAHLCQNPDTHDNDPDKMRAAVERFMAYGKEQMRIKAEQRREQGID